jgi:hypothetical protein
MRYRVLDKQPFDKVSSSANSVQKVADTAYVEGLNALLDYIESL